MGLLILILYILREYEINLLNLFVVLIAIIEFFILAFDKSLNYFITFKFAINSYNK